MTDPTTPSRRAGLRDEIAAALEAADYRMDMRRGDLADAVLPVLYREWPWLRAEAEDAAVPLVDRAALRDRIAEALYAHDHPGHLVPLDGTGMGPAYRESADAVLAVLPEPADRAAVLRDFLWRLEQSAGDAAAEKLLDDNPELRRLAGETADNEPETRPACPDPIECSHEAALGEAEAEAERQLAAVQRVRRVLEVEPVLNRSALEYRGLILNALMDDQPAAGARQDGAQP